MALTKWLDAIYSFSANSKRAIISNKVDFEAKSS